MKLQGEYDFKDFMELYFNKYYFNSKQNLANRVILKLGIFLLAVEAVLFLFFSDLFSIINSYVDPKLVLFIMLIFAISYFFRPKLIYETYKKQHKPNNYIEVDEKEFKMFTSREIKLEMKRLRNTVVLKHGYYLDFDETFIFYIPHRFFRSSEELKLFHNLCYKAKA